MRHNLIYAENREVYNDVTENFGLFGLREIRINAATAAEQQKIYYNDFGLQMGSDDIRESMDSNHKKHWLWKITPGDLTKWMGIPWQSDAGSCQAVYVDKQYPIPAWWAANLNMVYEWNHIGMVTVRELNLDIDGIPKRVYVAYHSKE